LVPSIWHSNISEIPWFDFSASPVSRITHRSLPSDKSDPESQTVYGDAFHSFQEIKENGEDHQHTLKAPPRPPWLAFPRSSFTISVASFTPAWAKKYNAGLTRGLHNPFDRSPDEGSPDHQTLDELSDPIQRPARVMTKPAFEDKLHERDDDPFAAPSKDNIVTTNVPDGDSNKTRSLQTLPGFSNLPRWSNETNNQDQDTGKQGIGMLMLRNPSDRTSETSTTTATAVHFSPSGRKSVSSLFPHDVREEDWNLPLTKPPFRNGRGQGWTTADAVQDAVSTGRGQGTR